MNTADTEPVEPATPKVNPLDNPDVFVNPDLHEHYRKQKQGDERAGALVPDKVPEPIVSPETSGTGAKPAPSPTGPVVTHHGPGSR